MAHEQGAARRAVRASERIFSERITESMALEARAVAGVPGLARIGAPDGLETQASLAFMSELVRRVRPALERLHERRQRDREFIDSRTRACVDLNRQLRIDALDPNYDTVIGQTDGEGRVVIGPQHGAVWTAGRGAPVAPIPAHLCGDHVTLFGPPEEARLCVNAMNAIHRRLAGEPAIVEELLRGAGVPKWGADDEDSKTPLSSDLVRAAVNLARCYDGTLVAEDASGRRDGIAAEGRALPIKRIPGLALPSPFMLLDGDPVPLHLYDLAFHMYEHWQDPAALALYVPKLESEEEAAYLGHVLREAEAMLSASHPAYGPGSVRVLIVLESARAIFRINEIMDALHPYFAGASLGWHDFLASTARVFQNDPSYRIPAKSDPHIVVRHIRESHDLLVRCVRARGGIAIGGMYGVLPIGRDLAGESFQVAIAGFVRDVIAQMKRGLQGFWVAHPDFVRIGMALVAAWRRHEQGDRAPLTALIEGIVAPPRRRALLELVEGPDVSGLDREDGRYARAVVAADLRESSRNGNADEQLIRGNVSQSLRYLVDWLAGNGCVALPTTIESVAVRVMDDLATCERSRWEVWHEVHHGRFEMVALVAIVHEETRAIRAGVDGRWLSLAQHLVLKLMTDARPVEWATELLLPFCIESLRASEDPLAAALALDPSKFALDAAVRRASNLFHACGSRRLLAEASRWSVVDPGAVTGVVMSLTKAEVIEAAAWHGDLGASREALDATAAHEQAGIRAGESASAAQLRALGEEYKARFGFKFLASAMGRSGAELVDHLRERLGRTDEAELNAARAALATIARSRLAARGEGVIQRLELLRKQFGVRGVSIAVTDRGTQAIVLGERAPGEPVETTTSFQLASLSKVIASCITLKLMHEHRISHDTRVNDLLARLGSPVRCVAADPLHPEWADRVTVAHLLRHEALGMHYVDGDAPSRTARTLIERIAAVAVVAEPGSAFGYSGGGFLVLEHIAELLSHQSAADLVAGMLGTHAGPALATGHRDSGEPLKDGRLVFPLFAAGIEASATQMARVASSIAHAYEAVEGSGDVSHDTAVQMVESHDRGSRAFMGCDMGLGVFTREARSNRFIVHQGANDGFRALLVQCYRGPDAGKGVVILCNAEARGAEFIARAATVLLECLEIKGVDWTRVDSEAAMKRLASVPHHEGVNAMYRELLFSGFEPDLPEEVERDREVGTEAASNRAVGARVAEVTDQSFACAANLVSPWPPSYDASLFGAHGKIMDSWETARHSPRGRDWVILDLTKAAQIDLVTLSTQFHSGNHAPWVSIDGWCDETRSWYPILDRSALSPHSEHAFSATSTPYPISRVRVTIEPDGGLTRLGLFDASLPAAQRAALIDGHGRECPPFQPSTQRPLAPVFAGVVSMPGPADDMACAAFGARVVGVSNEHYGRASQVISPYPPQHMFDGLESARSRNRGHREWVTIELARAVRVTRIELDFTHFRHNNPQAVMVDGFVGGEWKRLVGEVRVKAYAGSVISLRVSSRERVEQVRVWLIPDGGVNRVHVYGEE